jgi:O-methyltransferase
MCYGLWSLVEQCSKLSGALMEVGVWRGGTGGLIAKAAEKNGITDNVYLCDNFEGLVKIGSKDWFYKGGELKNSSEAIVLDLIQKKLDLKNVKLLRGIFPEETAHLVTDHKFRFCHIDVVLYESGKDIIDWIWDKMVVGGVLVFDDYGFRHCSGITHLVNERKDRGDTFYLYNLCGHGILIKR